MPLSSKSSVNRASKKKGGGLGNVGVASKRQQEKRNASSKKWVNIGDGDSVVLRVLDVGEDFKDVYVHRVPFERENGSVYYLDVPCLDQDEDGTPCPGCADDLQRRYKFYANSIVRDWEDPETGKVADTLMILSGGIMLAKALNKKHQRHGLDNRDIVIEREGTKKQTVYEVDWADEENTPLTSNDKKLAKDKYDFTYYTKLPDFDDFYTPPSQRDKDDDDVDYKKSAKRDSAFKRKRDDDDDDDDDDRPSRRSKTSGRKPKSGLAGLKARKQEEDEESSSPKKRRKVRR